MEQKYWYFGIRTKKSSIDTFGRMRSEMHVLWSPTVYENERDAAQAAAQAMVTRPGVSFFIQGFDKQLAIQQDGTSMGFIKEGE